MKTSIKNSIVVLAAALAVCACIDETPSKGKVYYGAEAVDMGLSVRWASCNVGAKSPEEFGEYFDYVDSVFHFPPEISELYNAPHYKDEKTSDTEWQKKMDKFEEATRYSRCVETRQLTNGQSGKYWRYPTYDNWEELFKNSVVKPKTYNGVQGLLFISRKNGNRIFLPAAGFFRKSTGKMASQGVRGYYYRGYSVYTFPTRMPLEMRNMTDKMPREDGVSFRLVFPNDSLLNAVEK